MLVRMRRFSASNPSSIEHFGGMPGATDTIREMSRVL
jgi:hypothetical protein